MRIFQKLSHAITLFVLLLMITGIAGFAFATALTKDRNTPYRTGEADVYNVGIANRIYAGSIVAINVTTSDLQPAGAVNTLVVVGVAQASADNRLGASGDKTVAVDRGVYRFANGDTITIADIGKICYAGDDQTIYKGSSSGNRPVAGRIVGVDSSGVWVDFRTVRATETLSAANLGNDTVTIPKLSNGLNHTGAYPVYAIKNDPTNQVGTSLKITAPLSNSGDHVFAELYSSTAAAYVLNAVAYDGFVNVTTSAAGGLETGARLIAFRNTN